jgi:hypothetical protein
MTLTVACVLVRGHVAFSPVYVERLLLMVRRFVEQPFRFVCLTDQPNDMPGGVMPIRIPTPKVKGWWSKVELFNPGHGFRGRMLYLDLDVLLVGKLAEIVNFPAPFALVPDAGSFKGAERLKVVKRYNSSCMAWDAGYADKLFKDWSPDVAQGLWGDQDWIGEQMPDEAVMPAAWFPRISQRPGEQPWTHEAKVVLCKKPKNEEAARLWPWFQRMWG